MAAALRAALLACAIFHGVAASAWVNATASSGLHNLTQATHVAFVDVDARGHPDVLVVSGSHTSRLRRQLGDSLWFAPFGNVSRLAGSADATWADVDGDGWGDLVAVSADAVQVAFGDAVGGLMQADPISLQTVLADTLVGVGVGDLTTAATTAMPDGVLDVVLGTPSGTPPVYMYHTGGRTFGFGFDVADTIDRECTQFLAQDVDGDGHLDLWSSGIKTNTLRLLVSPRPYDDRDNFMEQRNVRLNSPNLRSETLSLVSLDYDRDNNVDAFACGMSGRENQLWRNIDGGMFDDVAARVGLAQLDTNWDCLAAVAIDYNADGYPDLFLAFEGGVSDQLLRNDVGMFVDETDVALGGVETLETEYHTAMSAFLDGDGDLDLLLFNHDSVLVLSNPLATTPYLFTIRVVSAGGVANQAGATVRLTHADTGEPLGSAVVPTTCQISCGANGVADVVLFVAAGTPTNIAVSFIGGASGPAGRVRHSATTMPSLLAGRTPSPHPGTLVVVPNAPTVSVSPPAFIVGVTQDPFVGDNVDLSITTDPPAEGLTMPSGSIAGQDVVFSFSEAGGGEYNIRVVVTADTLDWPWAGLPDVELELECPEPCPSGVAYRVALSAARTQPELTFSASLSGLNELVSDFCGSFADCDGDGLVDLFWHAQGNGDAGLYINTGLDSPRFAHQAIPETVLNPLIDARGGTWADLVNDGEPPDYFQLSSDAEVEHVFMVNNGSCGFELRTEDAGLGFAILPRNTFTSAVPFDVDRDGDLDLFMPTGSNIVSKLLINDGAGHFIDQATLFGLDGTRLGSQATVVDVDGDGYLDIISNYRVYVFEPGTARFALLSDSTQFPDAFCASGNTNQRFLPVDLGNTGRVGLLQVCEAEIAHQYFDEASGIWAENAADWGLFYPGEGFDPSSAMVADIDGNGYIDVVIPNRSSGKTPVLFFNTGTFMEERAVASGLSNIDADIAFADLDHDGFLDFVMSSLHMNPFGAWSGPRRPSPLFVTVLSNAGRRNQYGAVVWVFAANTTTCLGTRVVGLYSRYGQDDYPVHFAVPRPHTHVDLHVKFVSGAVHTPDIQAELGGVALGQPRTLVDALEVVALDTMEVLPASGSVGVGSIVELQVSALSRREGLVAPPGCCTVNGFPVEASMVARPFGVYSFFYTLGGDHPVWAPGALTATAQLADGAGLLTQTLTALEPNTLDADVVAPVVIRPCAFPLHAASPVVTLCVACDGERFPAQCTFTVDLGLGAGPGVLPADGDDGVALDVGPLPHGATLNASVVVRDFAGNAAPPSFFTTTVDLVAPAVAFNEAPVDASGDHSTQTSTQVSFACSEDSCRYEYILDGSGSYVRTGSNTTASGGGAEEPATPSLGAVTVLLDAPPRFTSDTDVVFEVEHVPTLAGDPATVATGLNLTTVTQWQFDGDTTWASTPNTTLAFTGLGDGPHSARLRTAVFEDGSDLPAASDALPLTYDFVVDTVGPSTALLSSPPLCCAVDTPPPPVLTADHIVWESPAVFVVTCTEDGAAGSQPQPHCVLEARWAAVPPSALTPTNAIAMNTSEAAASLLSGSPWAPQASGVLSVSAEGGLSYVMEVRAVDAAGNTGPAQAWVWTMAPCGPPPAAVVVGADTVVGDGARHLAFVRVGVPPLEVAADHASIATRLLEEQGGVQALHTVSVEEWGAGPAAGAAWDSVPSAGLTLTALAAGMHHRVDVRAFLPARCEAASGSLTAVDTLQWLQQTAPPALAYFRVMPDALSTSTIAMFEVGASRSPAWFLCSLDGTGWTPCTAAVRLGPLGDGKHTFAVRAVSQGDAYTAVDPVPSAEDVAAVADAVYVWTVSAAADSSVVLDGLADGTHVVQARALDLAGNVGSPESVVWVVDTASPDTAASRTSPRFATSRRVAAEVACVDGELPTSAADVMGEALPPLVGVCWEIVPGTEDGGVDVVQSGTPLAAPAGCTFNTSVTVTVPTDGSFALRLACQDRAGHLDASPIDVHATVDATPPSTAAVLYNAVEVPGVGAVVPVLLLNITASEPLSDVRVVVTPEGGVGLDSVAAAPRPGAGLPVDTPFTNDTVASVTVGGVDLAGNEDPAPAVLHAVVDVAAPVVSLSSPPPPPASPSDAVAFNVTVLPEELSLRDFVLEFPTAPLGAVLPDGVDSSGAVVLDGLPEGHYVVEARARDWVDHVSLTPVTLGFAVDSTPPNSSFPATLQPYTPTPNITVVPAATDALLPTTVEVRMDGGAWQAAHLDTPFTFDAGPGHHAVEVRATDAAGNVQPPPFASVATIVDVTPPVVSWAGGESHPVVYTRRLEDVSLCAAVSDASPLAAAVEVSQPTVTGSAAPTTDTACVAFVDGGANDGRLNVTLVVSDAAGNAGTPLLATVVLDRLAPDVSAVTPFTDLPSSPGCFPPPANDTGADLVCNSNTAAMLVLTCDAFAAAAGSTGSPTPPPGTVAPCTPQYSLRAVATSASGVCDVDTAAANATTGGTVWVDAPPGVQFAPDVLTDGLHQVWGRAVDAAGNARDAVLVMQWWVDSVAPPRAPRLVSTPADEVTTSSVLFRVALANGEGDPTDPSSPGQAVFVYTLARPSGFIDPETVSPNLPTDPQNSGAATLTVDGLTDTGPYLVEVWARDQGGNDSPPVVFSLSVATESPGVVVLDRPVARSGDPSPTFRLQAYWATTNTSEVGARCEEEPQASFELRIAGVDPAFVPVCTHIPELFLNATTGLASSSSRFTEEGTCERPDTVTSLIANNTFDCVFELPLLALGPATYTVSLRTVLFGRAGEAVTVTWEYAQCSGEEYASFAADGTLFCTACPTGGDCSGTFWTASEVVAQPGFWTSPEVGDNGEPRFYECPIEEACVPGSVVAADAVVVFEDDLVLNENGTRVACAPGYTGVLCSVCAEDFFFQFGVCEACTASAGISVVVLLAVAVAMGAVVYVLFRFRQVLPMDPLKITISLGQVIASGSTAYQIEWPPLFSRVLDAFKLFLLDIVALTRANCTTPLSFYARLTAILVAFKLLLFVILFLPWVGARCRQLLRLRGSDATQAVAAVHQIQASLARRRSRMAGSSRALLTHNGASVRGLHTPSASASDRRELSRSLSSVSVRSNRRRRSSISIAAVSLMHAVRSVDWPKVLQSAFMYLIVAYPFVSLTVLKTFKCVYVEGDWWLQADMRQQCYTAQWTVFALYAFSMAVVYVVGLPVFLVRTLWRIRHSLDDPDTLARYGFLYSTFRRSAYMWEVCELLRKLILTSLVILFDSGSPFQITLAVLVSGWAHVLHALYRPYPAPLVDKLQHASLLTTFFVFIMGMVFKMEGIGRSGVAFTLLSAAMTIMCVLFIVFAVYVIGAFLRRNIRMHWVAAKPATKLTPTGTTGTPKTEEPSVDLTPARPTIPSGAEMSLEDATRVLSIPDDPTVFSVANPLRRLPKAQLTQWASTRSLNPPLSDPSDARTTPLPTHVRHGDAGSAQL